MLRATPEHVASPVFGPSVHVRPRVARPLPIVPAEPDTTVAVRGHVRNGSAAALIVGPAGVSVVFADRSRRRRVRSFPIAEILAVEEHRGERSSELLIVTATTTIAVCDVDVAQAWTFCREVRHLILRS
jgi:hypothetical protein